MTVGVSTLHYEQMHDDVGRTGTTGAPTELSMLD